MRSALSVLAVLTLSAAPATATPQAPVIALSNAYYGNTWRHQMVEAFEAAAKQAKSEGKIADYIVMNGDGSVAQQNSQIGELILKKVDVLLVDAASETAVNGVIEKACKAGIIVISFELDRQRAVQLPAQLRFQRLQSPTSRSDLQDAERKGQRHPGARRQGIGA